jgi:hypothetical protein
VVLVVFVLLFVFLTVVVYPPPPPPPRPLFPASAESLLLAHPGNAPPLPLCQSLKRIWSVKVS